MTLVQIAPARRPPTRRTAALVTAEGASVAAPACPHP